MIIDVSENGVLIPPSYLDGAKKVEVHRDGDRVVISRHFSEPSPPRPVAPTDMGAEQNVRNAPYRLGSKPVDIGIADGAENHDYYIYVEPILKPDR